MSSKKKQRNGFYFFMKDQIEYYKVQDKAFNMTTIVPIAHPKWQALSPEEKKSYNDFAKQWKQQQKVDDTRMDSSGHLVKEVMADELEQQQRTNMQNLYIRQLIGGVGTMEEISDMKFYLINFNIFCKTQEGEVIPAEIALVEYSIKEGIMKEYHEFIHPDVIPTGYGFTARQHSENTHKIPPQNFPLAKSNYMGIYNHMKQFVKSQGKVKYPVYCLEEEIEQTEGALNWLCSRSLDTTNEHFQVYDVARLLLEYCRFAKNEEGFAFVDSPALMKDWLTKSSFNHVPNISCSWHESVDASNHCSLSIVKCFCYLMSEHVCPMYKIQIIPNCHLPLRASSEAPEIFDWSKFKSRSSRASGNASTSDAPKDHRLEKSSTAYQPKSGGCEEETFAKIHKSKFSDVEDKVYVPGSTPGIVSEHASTGAVAAASFQPKKQGFEMNDEDFPPMGSVPFGRGMGIAPKKTIPTAAMRVGSKTGTGLGRGSTFRNLLG